MQLFFDFPVQPRYSFDNFIVCAGNRTACDFARLLMAEGEIHNLLYVYGAAGCGKTHLLNALGLGISGGESFPVVSCAGVGDRDPLRERVAEASFLLIDDIHLLPGDRRVELWDIFNDFHRRGAKIAVTGEHPPRDLTNVDEHLTSRLMWGLVARIDVSDDSSRRLILRKLADDRQLLLPEEVIEHLLRHCRRDIPSLLEALERLRRASLAEKRKITLRLLREAMPELS
ncbi:MAG TPA: DnaA/Hda family protein [Verrucomicrobiae bacterium]|nr:DnaA/Hda family protein [Verrucomicrobiae bacterium]